METNNINETVNTEKNSDLFKPLIVIAVAIVALAVMLYNQNHKTVTTDVTGQVNAAEAPVEKRGITIDNTAVDIGDKVSDPFEGRYVTYQGLTDITVAEDMTYQFQNPNKEDDVYMTFTITEEDKEIVKTDFIPAGKAYEADFTKLLGKGVHSISVLMQPYIQTEDSRMLTCPVNNAQTMIVTVND